MSATIADLPRNMQRKTRPDDSSGCWVWTGALNSRGYACVAVLGKSQLAHRVSYELFVGAIPEGLTIDHVRDRGCTHKACINPEHLEPVTRGENNRRAVTLGKHCAHGVLFDPSVRRMRGDGRLNHDCPECLAKPLVGWRLKERRAHLARKQARPAA